MPSTTHQALIELFRVRPALAVELIARAAHAALPTFATATPTETALDQLVSVEFRADLVVELRDGDNALTGSIVVEVQLGVDADKPFTWPVYVSALRARTRRPVWLLVIAPTDAVAAWARQPIELTPGVPSLIPAVLGPEELPPITEPDVARSHPELTLLAAVSHGRSPEGGVLLPVLPVALGALDVKHRAGYLAMLLEALAPAFRKRLEKLMLHPSFAAIKLPSPWQESLDDAQSKGEAKGKAEGKAEGKAAAILDVLAARGIPVSEEVRARVVACTDLATLDRWIRRAATLATAAAVVRPPSSKSRSAKR